MPALSSWPQVSDAAWTKYLQPRVRGGAMALGFAIRPSYLQQLFASPALPRAVRLHGSAPLFYRSRIQRSPIDVEIWAQRGGEAARAMLERFLVFSAPMPEPSHAVLKWGEQQISVPLQESRATIEGLALSHLGQAQDLRVELITNDQAQDELALM